MSEDKIRVSFGTTVGTGKKFEFERFDCSWERTQEKEFEVQFDEMFRKVKMKVLSKAGKFIEEEPLVEKSVGDAQRGAPEKNKGSALIDSNTRVETNFKGTETVIPITVGKTRVEETQNYVDVRECVDYSGKSYKLIGYDNRYTFIAKQHVIRKESIKGNGMRLIVSTKSAWVITKLDWKEGG